MLSECSICGQCSTGQSSSSPYSLFNLLPYGSLQVSLSRSLNLSDHAHAEDDWLEFSALDLIPHLQEHESDDLCRGIEFLTQQRFVRATYCLGPANSVRARIYLVPYDLPNVQGALRVRPDSVLRPARQYFRLLLSKTTTEPRFWSGEDTNLVPDASLSIPDPRTLSGIYQDISSPRPQPTDDHSIFNRLLDYSDPLEGLGFRSTLFRYQRETVAAMVDRETSLQDVPDPLYIPLSGINLPGIKNTTFFIQPGTLEVLRELPVTLKCRGGILCEELGTGKTVMILGLILSTLKTLSTPEPSIIDTRPVMTPCSFRHWPSGQFSDTRDRFLRGKKSKIPKSHIRVPSLREILIHRLVTFPVSDIPDSNNEDSFQAKFELTQFPEIARTNVPFYLHYGGDEPVDSQRVRRKDTKPGPRVMYLTSATLILVPQNLLGQWDREIKKHCEAPLRVLVVRSQQAMPAAKVLAVDYDIVLMTYTRFAAENNSNAVDKMSSWTPCLCREFEAVRVPNCTCVPPPVSPLLQVRWKRLVIDEGHVSASLSSILISFSRLLSVERRWICTGTPTTNLLGLNLGKKTNEDAELDDEMDVAEETRIMETDDSTPGPDETESESPAPQSASPRIWTRADSEDIRKLMNMITHFVGMPSFHADSSRVRAIHEALFDRQGPRPGAIKVLTQVMEMVMIRHRIEDVEKDIVLPLVKQESVLLDLDPCVIKSYNALQSIIAINAIDSERKDQDYMFHARNVEYLMTTIKNMSQLMFWHVDDGYYNVEELVRTTQEKIDTAISRGVSQADLQLLRDSFHHLKLAHHDRTWKAIQEHEDVPFRLYNLNRHLFDAWSRIPHLTTEPVGVGGFIHVDRLLKLRHAVVKYPLRNVQYFTDLAVQVSERDIQIRRLYLESQKKTKGYKTDPRKSSQAETSPPVSPSKRAGPPSIKEMRSENHKARSAAKLAGAPAAVKEIQNDLKESLARLERMEEGETLPQAIGNSEFSPLLAQSVLAGVRVGSSASSKLNYIINEVLLHSSSEKFIIFSDSALTLAHVSEALELVGVKFLRFTTQVEAKLREQFVMTFETSETYRVFLCELKHGARGLNLISASRIIFCEPVWQADVESQAIKRAHRIGQTKRIVVKTLCIRDTAEETMVIRRNALKDSAGKLPRLIEEVGMRHFIENPKFLQVPPESTQPIPLDIPLVDLPPEVSTVGQKRQRIEIEDEAALAVEVAVPKRQKTLRFA
ncbi:hypothetical protein C8J56DRAFT_968195 [Mycena floridula]|nr:hypothetical protein C8J56DRAFT_968195 [Mycena floridula]